MSLEIYREKYRLRSRIPMEWYSMLATVDFSEKGSQVPKKKGKWLKE